MSKIIARRIPKKLYIYRARDPEQQAFYPGKKYNPAVVSTGFNALRITPRQRFALKAYGKPFNYQGVMTKRYQLDAMMTLFFVSKMTIYNWVKAGYLPKPQIARNRHSMWLYHQVQPFYVWYWHMRITHPSMYKMKDADVKVLRRMQRYADMRWHRMLGIEYPDPYREKAGKYGVIYE